MGKQSEMFFVFTEYIYINKYTTSIELILIIYYNNIF